MAFASQPTPAQLAALGAFGFSSVASLSLPEAREYVADEAAIVRGQGLEFAHLPPPLPLTAASFGASLALLLPCSGVVHLQEGDAAGGDPVSAAADGGGAALGRLQPLVGDHMTAVGARGALAAGAADAEAPGCAPEELAAVAAWGSRVLEVVTRAPKPVLIHDVHGFSACAACLAYVAKKHRPSYDQVVKWSRGAPLLRLRPLPPPFFPTLFPTTPRPPSPPRPSVRPSPPPSPPSPRPLRPPPHFPLPEPRPDSLSDHVPDHAAAPLPTTSCWCGGPPCTGWRGGG